MYTKCPQGVKEIVNKIKAVAIDFDGVVTDDTYLLCMPFKNRVKMRSMADGQGVSLLRSAGIYVAVVTGEAGGAVEEVVNVWNKLPSTKKSDNPWPMVPLFTNCEHQQKVDAISSWLDSLYISWVECAAMGNDLPDYTLLRTVGLAAAPISAEDIIKSICHFVSEREAGRGALRDFCNFILECKGINPLTLATK